MKQIIRFLIQHGNMRMKIMNRRHVQNEINAKKTLQNEATGRLDKLLPKNRIMSIG